MIYAVFCADPLDPRKVEPEYKYEADCARNAGFEVVVVDHDELDQRIDIEAALKPTKISNSGSAIYRGWMLRAEAYAELHNALVNRNLQPFVSPDNYLSCHHAPNSIEATKQFTPKTSFMVIDELGDFSKFRETLQSFEQGGVIIKDWVKSQASGYWHEACYIPDVHNYDNARKVLERFIELQGESLVGGIVFKEYVPLIPLGAPAYEYRAFVVNKSVIGCWPRSDESKQIGYPPSDLLEQIAIGIESPFASVDLSIDENGKWWLLEVGDGQVSGLPSPDAAPLIFEAVAEALINAEAKS